MGKKTKREPYVPKVPEDAFAMRDGHHSGYHSGFDKKGDAIYPAPMHTQPMEGFRVERQALQEFINAMNAHMHREYRKLAEAEDRWWKSIEADLGLKRGDVEYYFKDECFRKTKPKETEPK